MLIECCPQGMMVIIDRACLGVAGTAKTDRSMIVCVSLCLPRRSFHITSKLYRNWKRRRVCPWQKNKKTVCASLRMSVAKNKKETFSG